ncbi:MAG: hypothetical protein JWR70_2101 [Modestobacter sp.]|nr:hypothetical protein [Modestobacter sp.]
MTSTAASSTTCPRPPGCRLPAGTLVPHVHDHVHDHDHDHDHASVPATLRALFAPHAEPLTARDAWATPFHDVTTLDEPRTDLPDLSDHTVPPAQSAAPAARTAAGPGTAAPEHVPEYYWEFVRQADQVRQRLAAVGEPEIAPAATSSGTQRGQDITEAFAQAAHRHQDEEGAGSPSVTAASTRPEV